MADEYLEINIESLRVSEIEEIEEILDAPIDKALSADGRKGKALRAVGYVMKRRENPDFTMEDAGDLIIRLSDGDPTSAAG